MNLTWGLILNVKVLFLSLQMASHILWLVNLTWGLNSGNDTPFVGGRSLALWVGGANWASW